MQVNQQHLKQAWDTSGIGSREDWLEWMHRLSVEFMKESPSHALRACIGLVDIHPPLARELFNAAFISCWRELYEQYQVRFSLFRCMGEYGLMRIWCVGGSGARDRVCYHVRYDTRRARSSSPQSLRVHGTRGPTAAHRKLDAGRDRGDLVGEHVGAHRLGGVARRHDQQPVDHIA